MSNPILPALRTPGQVSLSDLSMSPRARQTIESILADTQLETRGAPQHQAFQRALSDSGADTSFIDALWDDPANKDVVDAFMNNRLCHGCAMGDPISLEAYKTYAVQDFFYLVDYVKFKALRLTTISPHQLDTLDKETTSVGKSFGYAKDWYTTCITTLGIDPRRFKEDRSIAELAYANFLQNNTHIDNWFSLHVIMIACNYGWSKLALKLYPTADKTTVFYDTWIKDSLDLTDPENPKLASSAIALSTFLSANAQRYASEVQKESNDSLFRTSLRLEVALFNAAYEMHLPPNFPPKPSTL